LKGGARIPRYIIVGAKQSGAGVIAKATLYKTNDNKRPTIYPSYYSSLQLTVPALLLQERSLGLASATVRNGIIRFLVSISVFSAADAQDIRSFYAKWVKEELKKTPETP
jgi:hypothetical protein